MKNSRLVWFGVAFVFSLFICSPIPVLACGGGGGGGGGNGESGWGGPQSSSAVRPTGGATFVRPASSPFGPRGAVRPASSSFGRPGAAGYVGGINMGTPATVSAASRGAITANIPDTRQRAAIQEIVRNRPLVQSGGSAISAIIPDVKAEEDYSEIQRIVSQERPETQRQRLEREMRDNEELRDMLASYGDAFDSYVKSAEYAATAGQLAQIGVAIATWPKFKLLSLTKPAWMLATPEWAITAGKILLSGARGAADGYAYAAEKGEGGEAAQAAKSGLTAVTIETVTHEMNPFVGATGSYIADKLLHSPEPKQAQNRAHDPIATVTVTDQQGVTQSFSGGLTDGGGGEGGTW